MERISLACTCLLLCCLAATRGNGETRSWFSFIRPDVETFIVSDQLGSIAAVGILIDYMRISNQRRSYFSSQKSRRLSAEHAASLLTVSACVRACVHEMLQMLHRRSVHPPLFFFLICVPPERIASLTYLVSGRQHVAAVSHFNH